jgi:hypothetical protein
MRITCFAIVLISACTGPEPDSGGDSAAVTCVVDGVVHQVGDTWDADDCVNTCSCEADGTAECTDLDCP